MPDATVSLSPAGDGAPPMPPSAAPQLAYVHALLRAWVAHEREIPIPFYGAALEQQYNSPTNQLIKYALSLPTSDDGAPPVSGVV